MASRTAKGMSASGKENTPAATMDADASFDTFEDNYGAKESSTTIKIPKKDVKKVSNTSLPSNLKTTKPSAAKGKDKKDQVDIDVEQEQEVEEDEDDASQLGGKAIGMDGQDAVSKLKAMERDIKDLTATLQRRTKERDTYSKQFDDLSKKRTTESEALFEKYQTNAETRSTAQEKLIKTLQEMNERLQKQVIVLEKDLKNASTGQSVSATSQPEAKIDTGAKDKEVKALSSEVKNLKETLKKREQEAATVKEELTTELRMTQTALATANKRATSSSAPSVDATEAAKDTQAIKLYEDLTNLNIPVIKIQQSKSGDEVTFICVQTVGSRSLNFKLKCYTKAAPNPNKAGDWIYTKHMDYLPANLEAEKDREFVKRLQVFKDGFTVPRDQASSFWEALKEKMSPLEDV